MNKQQLAAKIWEQANAMRSKIEANEYKDYILGFIFYKYLSDKEEQFLKEKDFTAADIQALAEDDTETVSYIQNGIGYFIAYRDLFSTWISRGKDFDISNVRDALSAFARLIKSTHKKVFDGVFDTLQTGLSKLGDSAASQTKAVSELLQLIRDIPMDGRQDYDILGYIYEYLLDKFASNAGKKAGEFYTPHEVALLMAEIVAEHLKDRRSINIYDPTSGSGSLLINIGKAAAKHLAGGNSIKYYAQELKQNTYNLTRMNLVMRGIIPENILTRNADTLEDDWPFFEEGDPVRTYNPLYLDAVVSNPPYSLRWDPTHKETDPRYARYGLAPKTKADFAFLLHDLYHVKPDGLMTIVLPHGVLFRGGEEGKIRKNLIEYNNIDTIIGLPANIFFGTGIPTIIMVLKQRRTATDVLIIDASKDFAKEGKNNKLRACDIKKITDAVRERKNIKQYAALVSRETIRENDYNLNIPRYVDSFDDGERWDLYATLYGGIPAAELDELDDYWKAFPSLREALFTCDGTPYALVAVSDVRAAIEGNADVAAFRSAFDAAFADFKVFLEHELLENWQTLAVSRQEAVLCADIFARLEPFPLADKYAAYQLLDDEWNKIAADLEIMQTEGFDSVKKVDPRLIVKKKDGRDVEVQDGFMGRIIPFELVQQVLLKDQAEIVRQCENRLEEIGAEYEELIEGLPEDEKESGILNEDVTAFMPKGVAARLAEMREEGAEENAAFFETLTRIDNLLREEKEQKTRLKTAAADLLAKTKKTIENLSEKQSLELLRLKWIEPLAAGLRAQSAAILAQLAARIRTLADKYAETCEEIETQLRQTEEELCEQLDDLDGAEFDLKALAGLRALLRGEMT